MSKPPVDQLLGVNDHGVAVGFYNNGQGLSRGYTYNIRTHAFRRVLLPGIPNLSRSVTLTATAINNAGDVAGCYSVSGGDTTGFLLRGHHLTKLTVPGASMTQPFGVNNRGEVVGAYAVGSGSSATSHGFTWKSGVFTQAEMHAAHVHIGSCQSQGGVLYMLMDFVADSRGQISHETRTVTDVPLGLPAGGWYLNLHQGTSNNILQGGEPTILFRPLLCASI